MKKVWAILFSALLVWTQAASVRAAADGSLAGVSCCDCGVSCCVQESSAPVSPMPVAPTQSGAQTRTLALPAVTVLIQFFAEAADTWVVTVPLLPPSAPVSIFERDCAFLI